MSRDRIEGYMKNLRITIERADGGSYAFYDADGQLEGVASSLTGALWRVLCLIGKSHDDVAEFKALLLTLNDFRNANAKGAP